MSGQTAGSTGGADSARRPGLNDAPGAVGDHVSDPPSALPFAEKAQLCNGRDPAYPGTCPFPKHHPGPCFDSDDPEVDA